MLCGSLIKIWNLANHMKKQNKKPQNAKIYWWKTETKGLMLLFSCDLQDFKFEYVNRKAFVASFFYWVDFKKYLRQRQALAFQIQG